MKARAEKLNQFNYLKLRHLLVELRRQQYTIRDSFITTITLHNPSPISHAPDVHVVFDHDVPVFPLGLLKDEVGTLIFQKRGKLCPAAFNDQQLRTISNLVWSKKELFKELGENDLYFDFRNEDHVYQLLLLFEDLDLDHNPDHFELTTPELLEALKFYIGEANLSESQREILDLKLHHIKN